MEIRNDKNQKTKILFICLGNICRSPAANAVMQQMIDKQDLSALFYVDSAGIGNWHVGELPDSRMRKHGLQRGYTIDHIARQFDASTDFDAFDYIAVMDNDNYKEVYSRAKTASEKAKIVKMADYIHHYDNVTAVPDPYYGDGQAFEYALDLIEDGCSAFLSFLVNS